ncbi:dihydrofolate reductase [Hymenobacter sp. HMF4947]|uniref:Dihydrofolate reductase n=1 Tax=Hymenobacter ginkgonis TaxID=2682976 RepID=A0A7K1TBE5_9BACT|nr:dihydrofolate reductase family protein [Hymenobacter ginkgonis]MVN75730.1 dihydrofolate reductase [Hymenobacter ginkgonis]
MRNIIAAIYLTLDGVMEHPAWTGPYFNDELGAAQHRLLFESDALLLGRVTYQGFAQAWPNVPDTDGFANRMNSLPKYVTSRTLTTPEWNAQLLPGPDATEAVRQLKQQPSGNLLLYGSGALADTLRQHDLIDEYQLMVFPVVLGQGQRFFREGSAPTDLQLVGVQTTSTGVSILTYRRVGS